MTAVVHTRSVAKAALIAVPAILLLGWASGWISNSGFGNDWYDPLVKPSFQPPAWAFPTVWTILYALMGVSLALLVATPRSPARSQSIRLFLAQLMLNFGWSPVFFGAGAIDAALLIILAMVALVIGTIVSAWRIRPLAGALLLPYLAWLCLATALNFETGRLNPHADTHPLGITGA